VSCQASAGTLAHPTVEPEVRALEYYRNDHGERVVWCHGRVSVSSCGTSSENTFHIFGQSHADGRFHLVVRWAKRRIRRVLWLAFYRANRLVVVLLSVHVQDWHCLLVQIYPCHTAACCRHLLARKHITTNPGKKHSCGKWC